MEITPEFEPKETLGAKFKRGQRVKAVNGALKDTILIINASHFDRGGIAYNCTIEGTETVTPLAETDLNEA